MKLHIERAYHLLDNIKSEEPTQEGILAKSKQFIRKIKLLLDIFYSNALGQEKME